MKKIIILIGLMIVSFSAKTKAQSFSDIENMEGVTSMIFTQQMFKLMSKLDLDSQDEEVKAYLDLVESIDNIRIFQTENPASASKIKKDVESYLAKADLDLLMRVNEDNSDIKFFVKPGKTDDVVQELLMFLHNDKKTQSVLMMITGNVDLTKISALTKKMNVPGASSLDDLKEDN
ncbi:MAG: DUF4252 domain-containing protein [Psychroflexus sp.]|nr:DUF4252 domain-containing protein [Psychroflexus sp.]MDN6309671.1 DUF4252 domain-containing protein [Psychroflexus sp.]